MPESSPNPDDAASLTGLVLGRFRVMERVRKGAAGDIYLARDQTAACTVAIEVLSSEIVNDVEARGALLEEARAGAALSNPHLASVLEVAEIDRRVYLAMAPIEGTTLRELLATAPFPSEVAARIGEGIARGLAAAHEAGVVHGHLTADGVMLTDDGRVLVIGFGLATWDDDDQKTSATRNSSRPGGSATLVYAAPEQRDGASGDARADVYAFGVLLLDLLGGAGPDLTGETANVIPTLVSARADSLATRRAEVGPGLLDLVARCLENDPDARFPDGLALLEAFAELPRGPKPVDPRPLLETLRSHGTSGGAAAVPLRPSPALAMTRTGDSPRNVDGVPASLVGGALAERFEILALAGSGGMGEVYRARERATGKEVALKLMSHDDGDARRFTREAAVLATFDHPGVVKYESHGTTDDGRQFLAMEWLEGEDLESALARGPMSVSDTLAVVRRVAEALAATHLRGIVHRDLKPANLFLVGGRFETPKLVDFGLAREVVDRGLTVPGTMLGTPAYMAPEQIRAEAVDARADIYALGAVMFRCLSGHPPFSGTHRIAVLAKVLVEPPPSLTLLCPEVPADLAALVTRMLSKNADLRPRDGAAVLAALSSLDLLASAGPRSGPAITAREQRVACVILCAATADDDLTLPSSRPQVGRKDVRSAVEDEGGVLEQLVRGTWLVTVPHAASPAEQATRAVRCALAVARARPSAPVVIATGRVVVTGDIQVGEVIDRAAASLLELREAGGSGVRVDEVTASLVEEQFEVSPEGTWKQLVGERAAVGPARTLLGKPTVCVGRAQELGMLSSALGACADEPCARAVLLVGLPGLGKSRLIQELLRTTVAARSDVQVLFARGDVVRAGSPFAIVSQILRGAAGILESDEENDRAKKLGAMISARFSGEQRTRLEQFLGEICGAAVAHEGASPMLRAARADATVMGDALREAFVDWLRSRVESSCLLLVVEDLHWADLPSVRLLDAGLDALAEEPLMVLSTARPEVHTRFPDLWQKRALQQISLGPLPPRAAQRMVRDALGARGDDETVRLLVERAAGHPFHLEELLRAVAAGQGAAALPDSVLAMIQARFDVLGPIAKRALRAASVFGESFWTGGVKALIGEDATVEQLSSHLSRLVDEEIVTRHAASRIRGETEYEFRHGLVRDAAYATLTPQDRSLAHLLAGEWLEASGETDPAMLAEHFDSGEAPKKALAFFRRAAEQALEGNDLDRATALVARAAACGPDAATEGALWCMEAEISYWRGALDEAADRAAKAAERLHAGTSEWFAAVSVVIGAFGQRGKNDEAAAWLQRTASARSKDSTRGAHAVTLCRGMTQLFWAHFQGDLGVVRQQFDALVGQVESLEPYEAGWVHRVRAESAWLHARDIDRCQTEFTASCEAFERAHALRNLCLTQMNWASLAGWSGDTDRGLALIASARQEAVRLGSGLLALYAVPVRGLVEAYAGIETAEQTMQGALPSLANSPRLAFIARTVIGRLALERGDIALAEEHSAAALELPVVDDLKPAGVALHSSILLARGRPNEAVAAAMKAVRLASARSDLELTEGMADLALAEAHEARGDRLLAAEALGVAYRRLEAIAKTIASPEHRARFWARRLSNDRIHRLAIEWDVTELLSEPRSGPLR